MQSVVRSGSKRRPEASESSDIPEIVALQRRFLEERRERCILQRPIVGRSMLTESEAQSLVERRKEREDEQFSAEKQLELHAKELPSEIPAEFDRATLKWETRFDVGKAAEDFVIVHESEKDNPNFAPSGQALLAKRREELTKLRRAVNIVISGIRAKKMLSRLRYALGTSGCGENADDLYTGYVDTSVEELEMVLSRTTTASTNHRIAGSSSVEQTVETVLLEHRDDISVQKMLELEQIVDTQVVSQRLGFEIYRLEDYKHEVCMPYENESNSIEALSGFPTQIISDGLVVNGISLLSEMTAPDFQDEFE